jgi:hypothetical protein
MIILSQTTDNLQIVLAGNITTNQLQCSTFWRDVTETTYVPGRTIAATNNTTDVNIVAAPAESTQRIIDYISIYNADTVNATVTVKLDANGTECILFKGVIATGEMLQYNDKNGFTVMTIAGAIKQAQMIGANNAAVNAINIVVMTEDVINNNATLNTIADVTGLSFAVTTGQTYWFEFIIPYTAQATTTGSRWSISGPANPTMLNYRSEYTLAATTLTNNSATAYDIPAASNATSLLKGNIATIWGIITPSQNGTIIARFASEIANSAITAKAGATLRWMRVI